MNILVLCHYGMYQRLDSSFVHQQAKAYAELGHRVKAIVPIAIGKEDWFGHRWSASAFGADGVEIVPVRHLSLSNYGKKAFNTRSAILALKCSLKSILKEFQPDVIHAHTLGFDSEVGAWLKNQLNCPLVVTSHGSDTSDPYARGEKAHLKRLCDQADAVVGVSSKLVEKLKDCKANSSLRSILNGFSLQNLPSKTEKEPFSVIQVSNLIPQKKADITIRAFAGMKERYPQAMLTLIGAGPERESLETLCKDLNVADSVRFLGQQPNAEVLSEMAKTQFFVMPSHPEGFGVVYLEAMANGCITIGTEREGIADLIRSGENGFLASPDDPQAIVDIIIWNLEHPEEAAAIAERGREDALQLTWETNAERYISLFKELLRDGIAHTK